MHTSLVPYYVVLKFVDPIHPMMKGFTHYVVAINLMKPTFAETRKRIRDSRENALHGLHVKFVKLVPAKELNEYLQKVGGQAFVESPPVEIGRSGEYRESIDYFELDSTTFKVHDDG